VTFTDDVPTYTNYYLSDIKKMEECFAHLKDAFENFVGTWSDSDATGTYAAKTTDGKGIIGGIAATDGVIRVAKILIEDGTNADTIKATMSSIWGGDTEAATDNIGKGDTSGDFKLSANGFDLDIEGISGTVCEVLNAQISNNSLGTHYTPYIYGLGDDIRVGIRDVTSSYIDLTDVVGTSKDITMIVTYLTNG